LGIPIDPVYVPGYVTLTHTPFWGINTVTFAGVTGAVITGVTGVLGMVVGEGVAAVVIAGVVRFDPVPPAGEEVNPGRRTIPIIIAIIAMPMRVIMR
jgi:hypothetical protein